MSHRILTARCLCEAVHLAIEDAFAYAFYCHCSRCRRRTGTACAAIGGIELEKVCVVSGSGQLVKLGESADGYRCLCGACFSPLYDLPRGSRFAHVQLGALADAPSRTPDHHIQVASKAPWHSITDALPQFAEFPPS